VTSVLRGTDDPAAATEAAHRTPRFQLLGPLSIADGGEAVVLQPSKPTILLATLLLNPNGVVAVGTLQQAVWGDDQPATARAALQNCVLRLRQLFSKHGIANTAVETVPGGYRMLAGPRTLDLVEFRELVGRAAAEVDPEEERHLLDEALALWRGPLLANVPSELLHRDVVPRLAEERLRAVERVSDLKIGLGAARAALPDLWSAARANPGHERLSEQLIEALYRTGRQAEALAEIRRVKDYLRGELGLDAGRSLRDLEAAILRGAELGQPVGSWAAGPWPVRLADPAAAPDAPGPASARSAPPGSPAPPVPATPPLPATRPVAPSAVVEPAARPIGPGLPVVPHFTGRAATAETIVGALVAGPGVHLLTGPPGIGKTALALHVARLARPALPGPQALIPLSQPDDAARPAAEVAAALAEFLAAARAGRPEDALVVLDGAVSAEQLREPLAACNPDLPVIVTSRLSLAGPVARHGARVYRLDALDPDESRELLTALLGADRAGAEPTAVAELAIACGHFPLALRIVGARLVIRPRMRIADAVDWLGEDPVGRLVLPDDPRLSVPHRLAGWLRQFEPDLVDAFIRLAESAEPVFSAGTGAAVLGTSRAAAEQILDVLVDANLLDAGPDHFTMHDLLRQFARSAAVPTG
jgi:DNA-binding SARP family transcriptional activator